MALQVACPRCDFVVERHKNESLPFHCPSCGSRLTCPNCGSTLELGAQATGLSYCSRCEIELGRTKTGPPQDEIPTPHDFKLSVPGYELHGELGRGDVGVVYRAYQRSLNRFVAVKVLPQILGADGELLRRFRNEAAVATRLASAHILPVLDIQEIQGAPVMIMPLIEGTDLAEIMRARLSSKGATPTEEAHPWSRLDDKDYLARILPLLDQVVDAVATLHMSGVLHRDIKPSNVLVDNAGNAWLSDCGLARLQQQDAGSPKRLPIEVSCYASRELARGEGEVDFRSDLFSLGAMIYHMLTLALPYGRSGALRSAKPPAPATGRQPLLSRDVDTVLGKALEINPRLRYGSAAEMQEDWRLVRNGLSPRWAKRPTLMQRLTRLLRRYLR